MDCTVHGVAKTQLSDFSLSPSPILNLCGNNSNIKVYHCDVAAVQNKYGKISQKKKVPEYICAYVITSLYLFCLHFPLSSPSFHCNPS